MGFIGQLIQTVSGSDAIDFILTEPLPITNSGQTTASQSETLPPDECYAEIFVESIWLPKARKVSGFYHGVVHVYSAIQRLGQDKSRIAFVSTPAELLKIDPRSARKVVTKSQQALGPIPWRGGTLDLELGLFSVKSYDLINPWLSMVTELSQVAGVNYVANAAPFVPFIRKGIELITGSDGESTLEIGLDTNIVEPRTGFYALVATDRKKTDCSKFSLNAQDKTLLFDGQPFVASPWLIFKLAKSENRTDFGTITDLREAWDAVLVAVRNRKRAEAEEAITVLRVTALASPDLIPSDAEHLAAQAADLMKRAFASVMQNKAEQPEALPTLEEVMRK